jgi:ABC-type multidrug transport system permease subunit
MDPHVPAKAAATLPGIHYISSLVPAKAAATVIFIFLLNWLVNVMEKGFIV